MDRESKREIERDPGEPYSHNFVIEFLSVVTYILWAGVQISFPIVQCNTKVFTSILVNSCERGLG